MNTLMTLKIIDAITTALTGLLAPVRQRASVGLTGQVAEVARGMFEIRAIIGRVFIAPGIAPFIFGEAGFSGVAAK